MASEKTCFKCGILKPLAEFYRHDMMLDKHLNKCKVCARRDATAHRAAKLTEIRAYDRTRAGLPHRRKQAMMVGARWRRTFPNRKKAQTILRGAVKRGDVVPLPCLICGEKAEAHHAYYNNPLGVVWLCSAHHKQAHAMTQRAA